VRAKQASFNSGLFLATDYKDYTDSTDGFE